MGDSRLDVRRAGGSGRAAADQDVATGAGGTGREAERPEQAPGGTGREAERPEQAPGGTGREAEDSAGVAFYFDLGSPYAYLSAERISALFADAGLAQPEWKPVLLGGLFARFDRGSWSLTDAREEGMREIERRARAQGIQPIRWPDPFPANTLHAMRVATYAKSIGRTVSFALAAFRQAFAGGRDLSEPDNVAIAAAACELHPNAIAKAAVSASIKERLRSETECAGDRGVTGVPTVVAGDEVFWGDDRLEDAVAAVARLG